MSVNSAIFNAVGAKAGVLLITRTSSGKSHPVQIRHSTCRTTGEHVVGTAQRVKRDKVAKQITLALLASFL
jgi:hypothetical protein